MKSPFRYVGFRLFLVLMAVMLIAFGIHTYLDITTSSSNLTDTVYASAQRASDLIARSTRYSMLLNRKEDVHQTILTLGSEPGFVGISIYNKDGEVIFSTDSLTIGHQVDLAAEACNICHASGEPLVSVPTENRMRVYESTEGEPVLGLINPVRNEPACSEAACHAHSVDQSVLGVLDVKMSLAGVETQVASLRRRLITSSLIIALLTAGLSGLFIYRVLRRPILRLSRGMGTLSQGNLDTTIAVESNDELGDLATAFNRMAGDLKRARQEIGRWTHELEDRVQQKTDELQRAQSQVFHMEKMASLGKLSASVAHEINNPLFGILTYSKLGLRELDDDKVDAEKLREYLTVVQRESGRCGEIVRNLLQFARNTHGQFAAHHLNTLVEEVMALLAHHFDMRQVEVQRDFQLDDDRVVCDARQVQQALIAPCINAVEAMNDGGKLMVRTTGDADSVRIDIIDTGGGIEPETLDHVFEPFYTTKEESGGLGLGLSVVYGIVRRHGGQVSISSDAGKGTTVSIMLPREPKPQDEDFEGRDDSAHGVEHTTQK
jgi:two-component system NtrC family sensor kinase